MPEQRNALQAVLDRQAHVAPPAAPARGRKAAPAPVAPAEAPPAKFFRPSRDGRRLIAGHFDPKVARQLKLLAAEEDTTVQALLEEALDLLFVKKGKGSIARV
jgi:hypothetical protein